MKKKILSLILIPILFSSSIAFGAGVGAKLVTKEGVPNEKVITEEKIEKEMKDKSMEIKTENKEERKRPKIHAPIIIRKGVYISSPYGMRLHPITKIRAMHYGIDIASPKGTYVYAVFDGDVIMAKPNGIAGNEIKIKHKNGIETRYLHMNTRTVNKGDKVIAGQVIGTVGNTGRVTGSHLHLELIINGKNINPNILFKK